MSLKMTKKINNEWVFTEEELDGQIRRAEAFHDEYIKGKPIATSYSFDPAARIVSIRTDDGSRIDFPIWKIRELRNASDDEVKDAYITKAGDAIHWDNLDAHYTIAGLAANIFGTREWMQELGRKGGSSVSAKKSEAARKNGAKGGRPRKVAA
jgi:general stress protein YciG